MVAIILQWTEVCNHDNQHCRVIEQCGSESQVNACGIFGRMVKGITIKMVCREMGRGPENYIETSPQGRETSLHTVFIGTNSNAYAPVIHPIDSAEGWDISEEVKSKIVNPPKTKRHLGRPRVSRILSQGKEPGTIRSNRCHGYGHN
ncbi:hypothetical protein TIFTF001_016427 [Ficus carica]|uniref:Uncharacterized protein n=1 Tax=Ficus carica TaxID=3494 RepID=A0AA88A7J8_FICCA|nr:hypothetical protein TIFTF001_016427 [Ficus carica]